MDPTSRWVGLVAPAGASGVEAINLVLEPGEINLVGQEMVLIGDETVQILYDWSEDIRVTIVEYGDGTQEIIEVDTRSGRIYVDGIVIGEVAFPLNDIMQENFGMMGARSGTRTWQFLMTRTGNITINPIGQTAAIVAAAVATAMGKVWVAVVIAALLTTIDLNTSNLRFSWTSRLYVLSPIIESRPETAVGSSRLYINGALRSASVGSLPPVPPPSHPDDPRW